MVLEHLVPDEWWENHFLTSVLLAFCFSLISIFIASKVFGSSSGIVAVVFLTFFLLPSMRKLFEREEFIEERERFFSLKHLYRDNKVSIKTYCGVFVGVFLAFMFVTFLLPQLGVNSFSLIKQQLLIDPALRGRAVFEFSPDLFLSIFENNWLVLVVAFLFAIIWGDGALFFVSWNASAWGAIFGFRALASASYLGVDPFVQLVTLIFIVMWHTAIEGLAYILAAIAGTVISDEVVKKSDELRSFVVFGLLALLIGFLSSVVVKLFVVDRAVVMLLNIFVTLTLIFLLQFSFSDSRHKKVFLYNYWLFLFAVILFFIGALLETYVLSSSQVLTQINIASSKLV